MDTSSSSSSQSGKYDVFLSFRGKDTRKTFTDHLYWTLRDHNLSVFFDENELERGEIITDQLKQAIEKSRISVVVFSSGYADSRSCLEELVKIMECRKRLGQTVLPIFFHVDPSHVRKQTGEFTQAFQIHEQRFHEETVQLWRNALAEAADLAGEDFTVTDGHQGMFIRKVIVEITRKLKNTYLNVASNPVGIESRVQEISSYLDVGGSSDVRIIGIWGMGGLGKTTVAKAICNKFQHSFDGKSFLPEVRKEKLVDSQNKLLSDILKSTDIKVSSVDEGIEEVKRRLGNLRVLVIVDDIDHVNQLAALAINRSSFGPGSRIIITTRDEHLLKTLKVDKTYLVQTMNEEEALEFFSWRAFSKNYPDEEYLEVSREAVDYCGGLPLALGVLGSYLGTKIADEWKSAFGKWRRRLHAEIHEKLKISYDGLTDAEVKAIFLDISCFFTGMNKDYVMKILDSYDCDPAIGIRELHERCLVTVDKEGNLMMHGLIRDTGREIVCAESPRNPGKRSRLWHLEDVKGVLKTKSGTIAIEGLSLDLLESIKASFSTEAFRKMQRLRLLKLKGVNFTGHCKHLSKELRWLCWHDFPLEVVAEDFTQPNLVDIDLSHSNIQVWKDSCMLLEKLKFLNLGYCKYLKQSPDFSKLTSLENLILENCKSLSKIHGSIGQLKNLKYLSVANCNLTDDANPKDIAGLSSLEVLDLRGNDFNGLPILRGLSKLQTLRLDNCVNLQSIPNLPTNLEILEADECTALEKMPDFSEMLCMRELHLNHSPKLAEIPGLDKSLNSMTRIRMGGCTKLTAAFKESIIREWSASGDGGLFLPGNEFPSWFTLVDLKGEIVVPQSFGCDLKDLPVCILYSSDYLQSDDSLCIRVANGTQHTQFLISPMYATIMATNEDYLWLGLVSNNKLNVKGGDKINVVAHFVGPGSTDDNLRVKKIGVNLEQMLMKEYYTLDYESMLYLSEYNTDANHKVGDGSSVEIENRCCKRLRSDPSFESNAEEETDGGEDDVKGNIRRKVECIH